MTFLLLKPTSVATLAFFILSLAAVARETDPALTSNRTAWDPSSSKEPLFMKRVEKIEEKAEKHAPFHAKQKTNLAPQRFHSPYDAMANMPHNIVEFEHASGNWFGFRDQLDQHGIELSLTYTSNIAGNPIGGKHPGGFTYCDNFALGCLLQTEKLFKWHGGHFMMSVLQRDGNNLSQKNIGNQFTVQQVYGKQTFSWYELSYQQDFCHDHASLKFGRFSCADDFAVSPLYWYYMNNGLDGNPQSIPVNSQFSCYPNAVWGSRLKVDLTTTTVARLGVYQVVSPSSMQSSVHGLNWNFYPNDGVMLLGQYSWNPEFFKPSTASLSDAEKKNPVSDHKQKVFPKGLVGHYWMGGYYSSLEYSQFSSPTKIPNTYGFYWNADQMVYRPNKLTDEGLVLWSAYTLSPQQNTSLLPFQVNGGAIYTGLVPGRHNDTTILGVAYGNYSTQFSTLQQQNGNGARNYELVYEAGYRIALTKFSYIQPDLQWIINPAGTSSIPNALVLGAQMGVIF